MNNTRSLQFRRAGALAAALALLAPAALAAQQQPAAGQPTLTLEQALSTARERNPELLQQKNDIRSARAAVRESRLDFLPSANVSTTVGYTAPGEERLGFSFTQETPSYYSSQYRAGISYNLSGAKLMQPRIARAQEAATAERIEGYEANLVSQVAQQYISALQALEQAEQAVREAERTREHERLARGRLEAGAGTPLDLRRAEVQRGQAEVAVLQRQNDYQTQLLRLGQAMGTPVPPTTRLSTSFQLFEPRWSADSLVALAMAGNPNLDAARASARAARTSVRAARTQYLPSLSFSAGITGSVYSAGNLDPLYESAINSAQQSYSNCLTNNRILNLLGDPPRACLNPAAPGAEEELRKQVRASNPSFPFDYTRQPLGASLTLSLPIFNGYNRERQVEEARVQAEDADLAVRTQELRLRTEIEAAILGLQTAYRVAQLQDQVVQKASEELRLAQERFKYGVASSVEVTDAQTSLSQAEQARIDAVYIYHKSLAALEALVGRGLR
jgi:outer membrane protein